ncbi:MAG: thioesterase [Gammaproteobacteria bacterium]|nr:thioesterase [Gammaproteobacteria bacterium]
MNLEDRSVIDFRAGLTDVDMFLELNNARYFNYMELGRWDYSYRVGFISLMKNNSWGVAVGGASIRYRRRIPFSAGSDYRPSLSATTVDGFISCRTCI